MEVDNNLVNEFQQLNKNDAEFAKKCGVLSEEIRSGHMTVVQLIEQLGPLLVNVSPATRELGTWILTHVMETLPLDYFDTKQLNFICTFYADRLKDHHQVIPAVLAGILSLSKFTHFPDGAATEILSVLFQNVSCQQQQEQDRGVIYRIFDSFLNKHASELCSMGLDYVYGVISAVDGERNPKNLILLFEWFPKFVKVVNLGHLTEEAFEVLACYFPVDFKAPTQDLNSISRDQLAALLAPCLTAVPQFAEFCFPLALEKLDSSLEIAKLDSLKLLESGCSSFDSSSYVQHSTEIWSQIQKEMFTNPSPVVEGACLSALESMIKKISCDSSVKSAVKDITDTLKGNLLPDSKLFEPSTKLLLSVASATAITSELVTKEIVPILINTFHITATKSHKIAVLRNLVNFFDNYVHLNEEIKFEDLKSVPIVCLKTSLDENEELKTAGFECLSQIAQFLPKELRFSLYENLGKVLLSPQNKQVRGAAIQCFEELAKFYPDEIRQHLIYIMKINDPQVLQLYLDALSTLADKEFFTKIVVDILFTYLKKDELSQIAILVLKDLLQKYDHCPNLQQALTDGDIVNFLVDYTSRRENNLEIKYMESISAILKSVIRNLDLAHQQCIADTNLELIKPTRIFIAHGLYCCLRPEVIDYRILNEVTQFLLQQNDPTIKETSAQVVGNLVNKCPDEKVLRNYLGQFSGDCDVILMTWITKALVMRNHELANTWMNYLIDLLGGDERVAASFRVIMNDGFECLGTRSFSVKTFLYQQKFFTLVSNKLCENFTPDKSSYLLALGYMLEHAPKQAILVQFKKLLKLIILCLDLCVESEVVIVILQVIKDFIITKQRCVEDNLSDFLARFLKLSFDKSMQVRILAVQCLQESTTSFPIYKLLMHKQEVLSGLGQVLDDKKRIVRREAVEARSLWFLLDAPQ